MTVTQEPVTTPPPNAYLTKREVAKLLRCTLRTVHVWMTKGLPHYRFGSRKSLFKLDEVERFMAKFRTVRMGKCARTS